MMNPSSLEMFMTPEQKQSLHTLKEVTGGIKAHIVIHGDGVEVKLATGDAKAAAHLPQIGEQVAIAVDQTLHYVFGITGEIVKRL